MMWVLLPKWRGHSGWRDSSQLVLETSERRLRIAPARQRVLVAGHPTPQLRASDPCENFIVERTDFAQEHRAKDVLKRESSNEELLERERLASMPLMGEVFPGWGDAACETFVIPNRAFDWLTEALRRVEAARLGPARRLVLWTA
jgi:hypothetical protein